jgi:RecJ-like exonuclease
MKLPLFTFVFFILFHLASAQVSKDTLLVRYMKEVKEKVSRNDFEGANQSLKKVFSLKTVLPDEVAFYHGYVQVKLKNYLKGKEGLQKYILLTEGAGEHYAQTLILLEEANSHICKKCNNTGSIEIKDTCVVCKGEGKSEEICNQCKSNGQEVCTVCKGRGVVVYKTSLGTSYTECSTCKGKGVVSCEYCSGTKKKKSFCSECKGTGFLKRKVSCDHKKD